MPIVRTYACEDCGHFMKVTLRADQWDVPAPNCPRCNAYDLSNPMRQEFKPVAITGSPAARARELAEDIAAKDYHVADMQWEKRQDGTPKVRYKDETPQSVASTGSWGVTGEALQQAVALGREVRLKHGGSGLDMLQRALKDGTQPDLIEVSKKRAISIW
jgi:hypothetical protein